MRITSFIDKLFEKNKGFFKIYKKIETGKHILAKPKITDINLDGELETIITTTEGNIYVYNLEGEKLWEHNTKEIISEEESMFIDQQTGFGITSQPLIEDINGDGKKEIIFGTEYGKIYALNSEGKILWTLNTNSSIRSSPCFANGKIMIGSKDKYIYIITPNGQIDQKIFIGHPTESTPTYDNEKIFIGNDEGELKCFNTQGQEIWTYKTKGKITSQPIILKKLSEKIILLSSTDNNLHAISLDGDQLWKYKTEGSIYSEPIISDLDEDGIIEIIIGSCDNKIHVLTENGIKKWAYETNFWVVPSAVTTDINLDGKKEIIAGSYDTNIYVLSGSGEFNFDFVPGISGIVMQESNFSDLPNRDPGKTEGQNLYQIETKDIITGITGTRKQIIATTKNGNILLLRYTPQ
ncbi:PQQ-binding-like beta-propeller repeat protein [Candidatus Woesearchaeota archaeon]|nr:PQQ-binding-like beta-propeller repeat protein [Candidatus Woesearchaeota archaeon]MCF7901643.1 PQQ-binding-like beta-propeller repeat protein [Candidatus Woesearchaeota archaeon]MCF8013261.1 PQQ-binding-like beta-propeller repeat protein [Candidatus Woesearchaeota archaeon]